MIIKSKTPIVWFKDFSIIHPNIDLMYDEEFHKFYGVNFEYQNTKEFEMECR